MHDHPDCARFWQNLSHTYLRLRRIDDAEAANKESLELRRTLFGQQHPAFAGSLAGRAAVLLARDEPQAALASIDQALAIMTQAGQNGSLGSASMRRTRASALKNLRRFADALAALDEADALAARVAPENSEYRASSLALRAEILHGFGRTDAARDTARQALLLDKTHPALSNERRQGMEALVR